ncbi:MAG: hypothetical protein HYX76_15820 [Acidobacteria bacterium]|nr:hypothetical protein [Acidobacteriota bacterium]
MFLAVYLTGVVLVFLIVDDPLPSRIALALIWPLPIAIFLAIVMGLALVLPLARPLLGTALLVVLALVASIGWYFW